MSFGVAFLVSFPLRREPMLAALGWPLFFAVSVPLHLVAVPARAARVTPSIDR